MSRFRSRTVPALALGLIAVVTVAPTRAQDPPPGPPAAVALTSGWQLALDPADRGMRERWQTGAGSPAWRAAAVPGVFDARPVEQDFFGTVGWYRLRFRAPATTDPTMRWGIRFDQVRRDARVWLNGRPLGRNRDPYVPFTLPAAGLRPGQMNTLLVRADSRKGAEPREGWWNWGGITRPVTLVPRAAIGLDDVGVLSDVTCPDAAPGEERPPCTAKVIVDGTLEHRGSGTARPTVALRLTAPDGTVTTGSAPSPRALRPGERARIRFSVPVQGDAQLWQPGSPRLYTARVETRLGDRVLQVDRKRVGLRSVRVRNGMLELNGRAIDMRGASIQEDLRGRGPALSDADIELIVKELKALGANVTRAHYLLNDRLLDRLDEEGILVWSQAPIYHRDKRLVTPEQRAEALRTLRGTVIAARSHPSVITHSVANELSATPDTTPGTRAFLQSARGLVHDLDPTLPVSVDLLSYPGFPAQRAFAAYDLLGVNSYFGWYKGKKKHSTERLADLEPYLASMRRKYPDSALVLTEFGAESTFVGPRTTKETYAFQDDYVAQVLDIVDRSPFLGGAIYWTLREFAVKPDWDGGAQRDVPRDGIHNKGLITYDGRPKPAWDVAHDNFRATQLFRADGLTASAQAAGGGGGGSAGVLAWAVVLAIVALLVADAVMLRGILRGRRRTASSVARR
ncbi:glycoside hydrolase family 2 protein [Paraconexibacter algicola]|uniref:glycoside hydrolase family 2 protein n=1 Tax=Paraconexibacter algicola TaxID=2133960 RepID=UPI0011B29896|nr:glycoside hydrolase family 2 TIM barrel-domain containing protein [Paraconexibacter algicola]